MKAYRALVFAFLMVSAPASAQIFNKHVVEMAELTAKLVGISPDGKATWIRKSLEISSASLHELDPVTAAEGAIGEELSRPEVDRKRLSTLVARYASESAAVERDRKARELDLAFALPVKDRQALGRYIESKKSRSLANRLARARLQLNEDDRRGVAKLFGQVVGFSPAGMDIFLQNFGKKPLSESLKRDDRLSDLRTAMGREIAQQNVNRDRLASLIDQFALAIAARSDKTSLLELAVTLPQPDRQALGRYYVEKSQPSKADTTAISPYFP